MQKVTIAGALLAATMSMAPHVAAAAEPVKIGVAIPLSGQNAQFGANIRNALNVAVKDINDQGGLKFLEGAKVELVYADAPTPNAAGVAAQRLISRDRVVAILGSMVSNITLAASEVTERAGVPMITHSLADQITERGYRYIFQLSPKSSIMGEATFTQAVKLGERAGEKIEKIAILWEDSTYGTSQSKAVRDAAKLAGVQVVVDQGYPPGITDVTPLINKLRGSGAQIIFPMSYFNDAVLIVRTLRQQQIDAMVVGGAGGYLIPDFRKALGDLADGVMSIAPSNYDADPALAKRYSNQFNIWPSHEALMYAAGLGHLVRAIEEAKSLKADDIRNAIANLKFCEGFARSLPSGCTAFGKDGATVSGQPIMVEWQGEELVTVYPPAPNSELLWRGRRVK